MFGSASACEWSFALKGLDKKDDDFAAGVEKEPSSASSSEHCFGMFWCTVYCICM